MTDKDARERVMKLFEFLKEYAAIRFPIVRDLQDRNIRWKLSLDELPAHPTISVTRLTSEERGNGNGAGSGEDKGDGSPAVLLRVRRPPRSKPPVLPRTLEGWVKGTIDDPRVEPVILDEREVPGPNGDVRIERFEEDEVRRRDWSQWLEKWRVWSRDERPAREAQEIYERFYELYGELQREGEGYELVLADGVAFWKWEGGFVHFPLILMPVQLRFNPDVPEFTIIETGKNPELYTALLQEAPVANPNVLPHMREQLVSGAQLIHPLEEADTTAYLKGLAHALSPDGEFIPKPDELPRASETHPLRIWRQPMLLLRRRAQGYLWSIENVLRDLEHCEKLPESLVSIVGTAPSRPRATASSEGALSNDDLALLESVFFTKPWNHEQLQIADRLNRFGAVLVQGPPGTGKTHTIANLIGHLLAQGKSVLVTAHTSKALRVLREHIPESLRSLAVSVLDDDLESRRQLEEAVHAITQRLSDSDAARLHEEARRLEEERRRLLRDIARARRALVEAIGSEYRSIVVAGQEYRPSDAARYVAERIGRDDWIPGPVELGAALPLSREELAELYRLNRELTEVDEQELSVRLPDPQALFAPDEFDRIVARIREEPDGHRPEWWLRSHTSGEIHDLRAVAEEARALGQRVQQAEAWELDLISSTAEELKTFEEMLLEKAEQVRQLAASYTRLFITHDPSLPDDGAWDEHERVAKELAECAQRRGGRLSWLDVWLVRLLNRQQGQFIQSAQVAGRQPVTVEHFQALAAKAEIEKERQRLRQAWQWLVTRSGGPEPQTLGQEPERAISGKWAPRLRDLFCLPQHVGELQQKLIRLGLTPRVFQDMNAGETSDWYRWAEILLNPLPKAAEAAIVVIHQQEAERRIREAQEYLASFTATSTVSELRDALHRKDPQAYRAAYERLSELHVRNAHFQRRQELLERLARVAPGWAEAIRVRSGVHGQAELPGDPHAAWLWRQFHDELVRRHGQDVQELQQQLEEYWRRLLDVTQQLVEARTWAYRIEKTTQEQRQALVGWANTMRRLGKGTGKSAPRLRREASALLTKAKDAVPVWIMPLPRVLEQFDATTTRFDVVIVDEASQCDVLGLIALYVGNEVVIVGDHEQVSPEGVGQELIALERLQNEYLQGYVPNAHLYDGKRSLYDIARESFGGHIMLTEHFRCVPEIIQFSNRLCYQGRIRPLRESHSTPLKPPVVPYRVRGTRSGKVNEEEAETIAALILVMLQHPAYVGKTIGVISMVGEDQAKHIERLVRRLCLDDPKLEQELEKRKFLCGTSAQFQGDERDVVVLSLVDAPSPDRTPLPLRNDERFKQRFNVAASRARDQLWVVYSLDPANDLKEGDLRRELIQFALQVHSDPESVMQIPEAERTESPFEREVLEYLVHRGYRVRAQWPVGSYRIDLVVEGETIGGKIRRVAIECDGDRYHPIEKIPEDLERQAVLERLDWRFIRIRGSEFYCDRASTMQRVERELERMGIRPRGRFSSDTDPQSTPPSSLAEEIIREAEGMRERLAEHDRSNVIPLDALSLSHTPSDEPETTSAPMSPPPIFSTVTSSPLVVRIFRHGRR
jgi:very-short-patch-repair endonuclease/cellulose biosynthesis protein BcsQ